MSRGNHRTRARFKERKEQRRKEALKRQECRDKLTPEQQLDRLNSLLGEGIGAQKERDKLRRKIEENKE